MGLNMKKKLLISGLGGSLFPYLNEKLSNLYDIFYVDSDPFLTKLYPNYKFYHAPKVFSYEYEDFIKNLISNNSIQYYIPLIDEELLFAKEKIEKFNNVRVIAPSKMFIELCLDKYSLMQELNKLNISSINSYTGNNFKWNGGPIFVKPITGRGSRGIRIINTLSELNAYYILEKYEPENVLIQDLILGTEYTVGVTINNLNQILSISVKKIIKKKGITQIAVITENKKISNTILEIVEKLKPCGPINIQLYLTENEEIKIFEINPRFSTTTIMSYEGGVDEISLFIDHYNIEYINSFLQPKSGIVLHRRWESVFYEE
jgi:carbamoyl-phosphate synthase large subunit